MKYRLGLDLGTNSIGWTLLKLTEEGTPESIVKMGVRIFSDSRDAKTKASLAVARRQARLMRRNRDRSLQRKKQVLNQLIKLELFPRDKVKQEELKKLDVLELRSKALDNKLSPYELGRAILHLSKKRGFLSSRKDSLNKTQTKLSSGIENLEKNMKETESLSVGDYLYKRYQKRETTKATIEHGFCLTRDLIKEEFDKIRAKQSKYHEKSDDEWKKLKDCIFYQRPLRPVEVGKCSLYSDEPRAYQYLPIFERFRLLSNLHNLRWREEDFLEKKLDKEQIKTVFNNFLTKKTITFMAIKKILGFKEDLQFTIEKSIGKGKLPGCDISSFFLDTKKGLLKNNKNEVSIEELNLLSNVFFQAKNIIKLEEDFKGQKFSFLSPEDKWLILEAELPKSYSEFTCAFSEKALTEVVRTSLEDGESPGSVIHDIQKKESIEKVKTLSYYGKAIPTSVLPISKHIKRHNKNLNKDEKKYGKIGNPTVHVGLKQLQALINELINTYSMPDEIHIEFARELKLNKKKKDEISKTHKENEKLNDKAREFITERGEKRNRRNIERVKMWFEIKNKLECKCVYSGENISEEMVLSEKVEIDHILPFSRTLDNSRSNKVLVLASENRTKKNKTPYEALVHRYLEGCDPCQQA